MTRTFPMRTKAKAFDRAKGRCEECGVKLQPGRIEYDHRVPFAMNGESTLENCQVLCRPCHNAKSTTGDVPRIAKAKRQQAKHIGAKQARNVIPGSKASPWKRKMDGTVEKRT